MASWIVRKSIPLVGQRTKNNLEFKYAERPLVVVYYDVNFSHQYVKGKLIVFSVSVNTSIFFIPFTIF